MDSLTLSRLPLPARVSVQMPHLASAGADIATVVSEHEPMVVVVLGVAAELSVVELEYVTMAAEEV